MAKYRIGTSPFYRLGEYHLPGTVIELPDDGKPENRPSKSWVKLDEKPEAPKEAAPKKGFLLTEDAEPQPKPKRPSDSKAF